MIIWKTNFADARVAARRHPPPCRPYIALRPPRFALLHRGLGLHGAAEAGGQRETRAGIVAIKAEKEMISRCQRSFRSRRSSLTLFALSKKLLIH